MLLALAYIDDGQLVAAAPACDVANRERAYWREHLDRHVTQDVAIETAYIEIDDPELVRRLLHGEINDPQAAFEAVEQYVFGDSR